MLDARTTFDWIADAEAEAEEAAAIVNQKAEQLTAAEAKAEAATAIAKEMAAWFRERYEDPAAHTPYCTEEGGYLGDLYGTREEIGGSFPQREGFSEDEWEEIVTAAVDEVEEDGGPEWAKVIGDCEPEPEPNVVELIRARDHAWGKGHVHFFYGVRGRTLCGKPRWRCPGERGLGAAAEINCKVCKRAFERGARAWAG